MHPFERKSLIHSDSASFTCNFICNATGLTMGFQNKLPIITMRRNSLLRYLTVNKGVNIEITNMLIKSIGAQGIYFYLIGF